MILKDISFPTPEENILFDEVLLHLAEKGIQGEVLRFWESSSPFIVLGKTGVLQEDVHIPRAIQEKIPVLRRSSGGGTVVQGKGCLNFSLVLSKQSRPALGDLGKSYSYILGKVIEALSRLNVDAVFKPVSDLALRACEKKFSGNAQRRARNFILHHGTILYGFDLSVIERFLKMPEKIPEYRRGRGHLDFVDNISRSVQDIKDALAHIFQVEKKQPSLTTQEEACLKEFLKTQNKILRIPKSSLTSRSAIV
ncbi:MAG TPA: lipoate--protein ligase family protein [Candidatus Omnitrophota bacterium]|nr:lipoate--protein ligase family protein [Candidatus Omnitrophota bacterium]